MDQKRKERKEEGECKYYLNRKFKSNDYLLE